MSKKVLSHYILHAKNLIMLTVQQFYGIKKECAVLQEQNYIHTTDTGLR